MTTDGTQASSSPKVDSPVQTVTVDAFEGRPPVPVKVGVAAPFGWWPAIILAFVGLVDRLDSAMVGGTLTKIQAEFGFSDAFAGLLFSVPAVAAALLLIPAGVLADRGHRTRLLTAVILTWSILTLGSGVAPTLAVFFLMRTLLGFAAPLNIPIVGSLVGDYYPPNGRSRAFATIRAVEYLGFPAGIALGAAIGGSYGWRSAFFVAAIPGLIVAAIVFFVLREPVRGVADRLGLQQVEPTADLAASASASTSTVEEVSEAEVFRLGVFKRLLSEVWAIPTVRVLVIAQALVFCAFSGLFSFSAAFFERAQGLTVAQAGAIAGGVGLVGILVGGFLAGSLGDRRQGHASWRIRLSSWSLVIAAVMLLILAVALSLGIQVLTFAVLNCASLIAIVNLGAATADVVPARIRGAGFSVLAFLITFGSAAGPLIVGGVSTLAGGNLRWGYVAMVVPFTVGALFLRRGVHTYEADARAVLEQNEAAR